MSRKNKEDKKWFNSEKKTKGGLNEFILTLIWAIIIIIIVIFIIIEYLKH